MEGLKACWEAGLERMIGVSVLLHQDQGVGGCKTRCPAYGGFLPRFGWGWGVPRGQGHSILNAHWHGGDLGNHGPRKWACT